MAGNRPRKRAVVYAAFKGMGDLLSASPVIASELRSGSTVNLLIFPNKALMEFVDLIDFGPNRDGLSIHLLPVPGSGPGIAGFVKEMRNLSPELVWISPHAPVRAASWKIPLLLWMIKTIYWPNAVLAGACNDPVSRLFSKRVPISRDLPLLLREWTAYWMNSDLSRPWDNSGGAEFIERIRSARAASPDFDLLIHPGANAKNRIWPVGHYAELVGRLPPKIRIAVLGLPPDVEALQAELPESRNIQFITCSLEESIRTLARARVVLTMDSGNVHFCIALRIPVIALFGSLGPESVIAPAPNVVPIYERKFSCQPCGQTTCSQREVFCMNAISPTSVAQRILNLLEATSAERF